MHIALSQRTLQKSHFRVRKLPPAKQKKGNYGKVSSYEILFISTMGCYLFPNLKLAKSINSKTFCGLHRASPVYQNKAFIVPEYVTM